MYVEYHCYLGSPRELEASIPLLLEIEGLSMPMSGRGSGSVDDSTSDMCGRGSMDGASSDTCGGGGGGGGSMNDVATNTSGSRRDGSVNGAASDACGGE